MRKIQLYLIVIVTLLISSALSAQNIDIETIGKGKAFKITGGFNANSVFYSSSQNTGREPFTYFLQGNLNLSVYNFSMPVSYSFTNQGGKLAYSIPFKFNRLSLHPRYKWVQAHIGDVAMSFSPYTLSGHEFTGGGIELTPSGSIKFSAMAGQFLKATPYDGNEQTIPAFKRMGYSLKTAYELQNFSVGLITFYAKDNINSIADIPEEQGVLPKENMVISFESSYTFKDGLQLNAEYASSALTQDIRAVKNEAKSKEIAGIFINEKASTEFFNALKAGMNYITGNSSIGLTYERIDPGYQTLGAYYFNNDFENITLNATTVLFEKLNLAFNIGYQRDDLNKQKQNNTSRMVGAVNASINPSEKWSISGSYSNFRTFTNTKLNQFDLINDDNLLDNDMDRLDYKQLSQNANLNINYIFSNTERSQQNININYALADVANEQDGIVRIGDASTFHNLNTSYSLGFPKRQMNITTAINATFNTIGREDATTWGPTINIHKKFLKNKLSTSFGASYNKSENSTSNTSISNFRVGASYAYKNKHNFNLNAIQLFRTITSGKSNELSLTIGYNYAF